MPKTFVVVPRQDRGLITSRPAFLLDDKVDSFSALTNFVLTDGAWTARLQDLQSTLPNGSGVVWAFYATNAKDPSAPAGTSVLFGPFGLVGGNTNGTGTSSLWRTDTGAQVQIDGVNVTCTDPHEMYFLSVKNRVFFTGAVMSSVPGIITKFPSATSYRWGAVAPTNDMQYDAYNAVNNAVIKQDFQAAGTGVTNGSTAVTGSGFTADPAWVGKTILINGTEEYTIRTVTGAGTLTLTKQYTGTTGTYDRLVRFGNLSWGDVAPTYAYAYYDPATGHISNVGPPLTFSEKNISNVGVNLQGIQCTNDARFTRIVLFRNNIKGGGSILYPMFLDTGHGGTATVGADGMIVNTGVGSVSYRDYLDDNKLTLFGGQFVAGVRDTHDNNPPPADAKFTAYWDQRVWTISAATPYRLMFSANSSETPLGVAEECFPIKNFKDIPSEEGKVIGLKTVGDQLIICTEKSLYTVGTGYRLVRISSRGAGVDHFAIAEYPGDTSNASASVVYLSVDARLWRQYQDGRIVDIGEPIQDKLDALNLTVRRPAFVNIFQLGKNWLLAIGLRNANTRYDMYFLDLDRNTWLDWGKAGTGAAWTIWSGAIFTGGSFAPSGFAVVGRNDGSGVANVDYLGFNGGARYASATMFSNEMDFGDRTAKKTLQAVNFYVNTPTENWDVAVAFDGSGSYTSLARQIISGTPRAAGPNIIRFNTSAVGPVQFHSINLRITSPSSFSGVPRWYKYEIVYESASTDEAGSNN